MIGRTAGALLAGLHVDLQPAGWRLVARPGVDERRARDYLRWDLDAVETAYDGYTGPLKVQAVGPWTLAAGVELPKGDRALSDAGAVRDLAAALAEGIAEHVAEVGRRVPGATVVVQYDEPSLPYVAAGRIKTASGFGTLRAVGSQELEAGLRATLTGAPTGVHCCAPDVPYDLLRGLAFVSFDVALVTTRQYDALAQLVEDGVHLLAGSEEAVAIARLWKNLSHPPEMLPRRVTVTPACGLAGRSPTAAREALKRVDEAARRLREEVR